LDFLIEIPTKNKKASLLHDAFLFLQLALQAKLQVKIPNFKHQITNKFQFFNDQNSKPIKYMYYIDSKVWNIW